MVIFLFNLYSFVWVQHILGPSLNHVMSNSVLQMYNDDSCILEINNRKLNEFWSLNYEPIYI